MRFALPAALLLVAGPAAYAQGTAEQREACTPDAVRLCSDTIPDVAKTTACMTSHLAELSPRCRAVVAAAPAVAAPPPARKAVGRPPAHRDVVVRYPAWSHRAASDPDMEVPYTPPRRVIEPPALSEPGPVIFPRQPLPDGSFCSPPYDFCEPPPDDWW